MPLAAGSIFPTGVASATNVLNWKNKIPSAAAVTLAGSISSGATSFTVGSGLGTQLPADNFTVSVDDEIMFVGSRAGDTLNSVVRAYEGTTASSHSSGAEVQARVTALAHNQSAAEIVAIETALGAQSRNFLGSSPASKSASFTASEAFKTYECSSPASGMVATLPDASTVSGTTLCFVKVDSTTGVVKVTPSPTSQQISKYSEYDLVQQWQFVTIYSNATQWVIRENN